MNIQSASQRSRETMLANAMRDFTVANRKPCWLLTRGYWL